METINGYIRVTLKKIHLMMLEFDVSNIDWIRFARNCKEFSLLEEKLNNNFNQLSSFDINHDSFDTLNRLTEALHQHIAIIHDLQRKAKEENQTAHAESCAKASKLYTEILALLTPLAPALQDELRKAPESPARDLRRPAAKCAFKDLFIVHSKNEEIELALFDFLAEKIKKSGISYWEYEDWKWTHIVNKKTGGIAFSRNPNNVIGQDKEGRYLFNEVKRTDEVNKDELFDMLCSSLVVVIIESPSSISEGKQLEYDLMKKNPYSLHLSIRWSGDNDKRNHQAFLTASYQLQSNQKDETEFEQVFQLIMLTQILSFMMERYGRYKKLLLELEQEDNMCSRLIAAHYKRQCLYEKEDDWINSIFANGTNTGVSQVIEIHKKKQIREDIIQFEKIRTQINSNPVKSVYLDTLETIFSKLASYG